MVITCANRWGGLSSVLTGGRVIKCANRWGGLSSVLTGGEGCQVC